MRYYYQASGHNPDAFNDDRYCPDCYKVVVKALSKVSPKVECAWVPVSDVDPNLLIRWDQEIDQEMREGKRVARRITMPLFDLERGRVEHAAIVPGRASYAGRTFEIRYWLGEEGNVQIREQVERDLRTGETRPWQRL